MHAEHKYPARLILAVYTLSLAFAAFSGTAAGRTIVDALGRKVEVPDQVTRVVCSGSGCPRLLTYLQAQRMLVGVDEGEVRRRVFDARPYAFANPWLKELPMIGMQGGRDNPEAILILDPPPDVILRTNPTSGYDPVGLQRKTGIPVVTLEYGGLLPEERETLYLTLRTMGEVTGREQRAEEVIAFFEGHFRVLETAADLINRADQPTAYVGGIAYNGAHGFQSTEPDYPPFSLLRVLNVAGVSARLLQQKSNAVVAREKILDWDPDYLFLDLSTLQLPEDASGLHELKTDPGYRTLTAVRNGNVYGVLPYNWCTENFGSILADCYFVGKLLYPELFEEVDPVRKADEIYSFLVGEAVFDKMNEMFNGLAFTRIPLQE